MNKEIKNLVAQLDLQPHPEGGYYKETYRSKDSIPNTALNNTFVGDRNQCTAIYFLLTSDTFSAFHKINQDEAWHFYKGTTLKLHTIAPNGSYSFVLIGNNFEKGEIPQYIVPAQHWFAAEVIHADSYSLLGCTVAPGFDFRDFVLANRQELMVLFPNHSDIITKLTRE